MSKIRISVLALREPLSLVKALRKVCPQPLVEFKNRLANSQPFYQAELYTNDHTFREAEILTILSLLQARDLEPIIEEILYDESWDTPGIEPDIISKQVLLNLLESGKRQER